MDKKLEIRNHSKGKASIKLLYSYCYHELEVASWWQVVTAVAARPFSTPAAAGRTADLLSRRRRDLQARQGTSLLLHHSSFSFFDLAADTPRSIPSHGLDTVSTATSMRQLSSYWYSGILTC